MKNNLVSSSVLQEKLGGLTTVQKALLVLATCLLLGTGFYFLEYKSKSERISALRSNIVKQEQRLAELKRAAAQVDELNKELAQSEKEFEHLLALLPDQKEIPGLLESISKLGAQGGLENILFQPQPEQIREFYAAIPVRLDLVGRYHELGVFFDKISKLNRILKVENLTMSRQKDSSVLQVSCTIMTYRFIDQPNPPAKSSGKK